MNGRRRGLGLIAIPLGIILFFAAFPVIWFNEGRVDLSVLAEDSIPLSGDAFSAENEGKLVAVSGEIQSDELLGDAPYLNPQPFIHLKRSVEMYAWDQTGSEEDGYSYKKVWTSSPEDSDQFDQPSGHQNPPMALQADSFSASSANIGRYEVIPSQIIFGQVEEIVLAEGDVTGGRLSENQLYIGSASPESPQIGDMRIQYAAYQANQFTTVFGKQENGQVVTWRGEDDTLIYRGYALDREGGIAALKTEYLTALWGVRMGALAMFFAGLMMSLSPLRRILGYVPILGNVGNMAIAGIAFVVSLIVWIITLTIAIILHNLIALIVVLLLVGAAGYFFWSRRKGGDALDEELDLTVKA